MYYVGQKFKLIKAKEEWQMREGQIFVIKRELNGMVCLFSLASNSRWSDSIFHESDVLSEQSLKSICGAIFNIYDLLVPYIRSVRIHNV